MLDAPHPGQALVRLALAGAAAGFVGGFAGALRRPRPVLVYGPAVRDPAPVRRRPPTVVALPQPRPDVVDVSRPDVSRAGHRSQGGVGA